MDFQYYLFIKIFNYFKTKTGLLRRFTPRNDFNVTARQFIAWQSIFYCFFKTKKYLISRPLFSRSRKYRLRNKIFLVFLYLFITLFMHKQIKRGNFFVSSFLLLIFIIYWSYSFSKPNKELTDSPS